MPTASITESALRTRVAARILAAGDGIGVAPQVAARCSVPLLGRVTAKTAAAALQCMKAPRSAEADGPQADDRHGGSRMKYIGSLLPPNRWRG